MRIDKTSTCSKIFRVLILIGILCVFCACAEEETAVDSSDTMQTEVFTINTEKEVESTANIPLETEAPTEIAVEERARELIRSGDCQAALALLEGEFSEEAALLRLRAEIGDVNIGDQIAFGEYEQDGDISNGSETIVWIVLEKDEDRVLLLSQYCLDMQPFHDVMDAFITWEESALRTWLNEEFFTAAFSETERKLIAQTELENKDNPNYGTRGGENTLDHVFLLSMDEAKEYLSEEQRIASVTQYAKNQGCYTNALGRGWWWLRSPGIYNRDACYISSIGEISPYGYVIHRPGWAVRPALWIDLSI